VNAALAFTLVRGGAAANRLRTALTIACVALGVALAAAVHTIHTSALAEVERAAHALAGRADLEIRGPRNGFDDATFVAVASLPEVLVASPIVDVEAALAGRGDSIRILGIDPMRASRLQPAFVAGGAGVDVQEAVGILDSRNAWITPAAAARLGLRQGSTFRTVSGSQEVEWSVAGILDELAAAGDLAVVDVAAAQWRLGRLGRLSRIDLRLKPGVDAAVFERKVADVLPAGVLVSAPDSAADRAASITRAYRVNLDALALIALATGAFLVFSTLALQAARRRQEFALLRALGVTRRGLAIALALEGALIGIAGAAIGTALGVWGSYAILAHIGADLGAGFFGGESLYFSVDPLALAGIAALGIVTALAGALWVAWAVTKINPAEGLRDRSLDLPLAHCDAPWIATILAIAGIPLLWAPPVDGLPLGGYAAIAAWLAATVIAVDPLCRWLLAHVPRGEGAVPQLASAQIRHLPGHLAASVAGIVMSTSLCVAMAIMVFSFRVSLDDWLRGVVGADLYVRSGGNGETGYFTPDEEKRVASLPEVGSLESLRYERIVLDRTGPPVSIVARPINERVLEAFRAEGQRPGGKEQGIKGETPVWVSEAARDLHHWHPGEHLVLPIAGKKVEVRVAGVIRDYARTWGAVMIDIADYRRLTGDDRVNDFAIHLAKGVGSERARTALRAALPEARGLRIEDAASIHRRSLEIFDRSFAVTYALEAIAVAIGLAGITSSFAALAWSRRREFGVLRFLGFRRRDILRLLAIEGATTGALGATLGLTLGVAVSLVLIHVVNRQSFHWTLEVHWPVMGVVVLLVAVIALCAIGARLSAAFAVRHEAILAVKDDA
jgi:putative ABC transport system permease protein